MTQLARLKYRTQEADETLLEDLLESARSIILSLRFPYGDWPDEVEDRYKDLQVRIAIDLYNKQGAEGESGHTENSVTRTYQSSWVSQDLLDEIVPFVGVVG